MEGDRLNHIEGDEHPGIELWNRVYSPAVEFEVRVMNANYLNFRVSAHSAREAERKALDAFDALSTEEWLAMIREQGSSPDLASVFSVMVRE